MGKEFAPSVGLYEGRRAVEGEFWIRAVRRRSVECAGAHLRIVKDLRTEEGGIPVSRDIRGATRERSAPAARRSEAELKTRLMCMNRREPLRAVTWANMRRRASLVSGHVSE